jgi:hypothetical protein
MNFRCSAVADSFSAQSCAEVKLLNWVRTRPHDTGEREGEHGERGSLSNVTNVIVGEDGGIIDKLMASTL